MSCTPRQKQLTTHYIEKTGDKGLPLWEEENICNIRHTHWWKGPKTNINVCSTKTLLP